MAKNGWGGKRPGAGRPKGSRNKRSKALLERLEAEDADPVAAIVEVMKHARGEGPGIADVELYLRAAKELLPYAQPRLSSQQIDLNAFLPESVTIGVEMPEGD